MTGEENPKPHRTIRLNVLGDESISSFHPRRSMGETTTSPKCRVWPDPQIRGLSR
jgi:hypothetical protein